MRLHRRSLPERRLHLLRAHSRPHRPRRDNRGPLLNPLPANPRPRLPMPPPRRPAGNAAAAPEIKLDKYGDAHSIHRLHHPSIFWLKLVAIWLLFLVWVKSCRLGQSRHANLQPRLRQMEPDPVLSVSGRVVVVCISVHCRFRLFLGRDFRCSWWSTWRRLCPTSSIRNKSVQLHQKVFTSDWFRYEIAHIANKVGIKMEARTQGRIRKGRARSI